MGPYVCHCFLKKIKNCSGHSCYFIIFGRYVVECPDAAEYIPTMFLSDMLIDQVVSAAFAEINQDPHAILNVDSAPEKIVLPNGQYCLSNLPNLMILTALKAYPTRGMNN